MSKVVQYHTTDKKGIPQLIVEGELDLQRLGELEEEIRSLGDLQSSLVRTKEKLEEQKEKLEQKLGKYQKLGSQKEDSFAKDINIRHQQIPKKQSDEELEDKLRKLTHKSLESKQEKYILQEIVRSKSTKKRSIQKKFYISLGLGTILLFSVFAGFAYYENAKNTERQKILSSPIKGKFLIKNAKGEPVGSGAPWNLVDGQTLTVSIVNSKEYPKEKIDAIKEAMLSDQTISVSDVMTHAGKQSPPVAYYMGWKGALEKAAQSKTQIYIPTKIQVLEDSNDADIKIELTDDLDTDGNLGYTSSVVEQNHVLLSTIKIYLASDLPNEKLSTIVRHEFGHALGLPHLDNPEDLMAPFTVTKYPYISSCDVNAIISLYDNQPSSMAGC